MDLQRSAKEMIHVTEIFRKLIFKTKKVFRAFINNKNELGLREISSLFHFNIGPSKWFEDIMKEAMLTGYEL